MEVNRASHAHQTPHVGFPQNDPVTTEIIEKINPTGAKLFASKDINLTLKIKLKIEAMPRKEKHPKEQMLNYQKAFIRYNDTQDKHRKGKTWRELLPKLESALTNSLS